MKIVIIIIVFFFCYFIGGAIITIFLGILNKSIIFELKNKKIIELKSMNFDILVSEIGNNYKEELNIEKYIKLPRNFRLYTGEIIKTRYFITRPSDLKDFREGYTGKKIDKAQNGEIINEVEIVGSVDLYWLNSYCGHDFKEIIKRK